MDIQPTRIPDVLLIKPTVFGDDRGFFMESWNQKTFDDAVGRQVAFVQDNHSRSTQGVLRGLHFQLAPYAQGKLVRVASGKVFDVAVDVRLGSETYGQHVSAELSAKNKHMLWIPEGFAHGFFVMSDTADFLYKTTNYYHPESDRSLLWSDPALDIQWPLASISGAPELSKKDKEAPRLELLAQ